MSHVLGGEVKRAGRREYGHAFFETRDHSPLLHEFASPAHVWMSHGDSIEKPPPGF
jgi:GMP synthase (glutamine-hydrolysing)